MITQEKDANGVIHGSAGQRPGLAGPKVMARAESGIHRTYETGRWLAANSSCTVTRSDALGAFEAGLWPESSPGNELSSTSVVKNMGVAKALRRQRSPRPLATRHLPSLAPSPALVDPKGRARRLVVAREQVGTAQEPGIEVPVRIISEAGTPSHSLYLRLPGWSRGEAFALGLMVAVCAVCIVYGFCSGVDLTQNWGLFSAGIQSLVR